MNLLSIFFGFEIEQIIQIPLGKVLALFKIDKNHYHIYFGNEYSH